MNFPLIADLKNDPKLVRNFVRIGFFLLLFFVLDSIISIILLKGVERNYGLKTGSEILLVGHSQLMLSIDKVLLERRTGMSVSKYTREGVNITDRKTMLMQYFKACSSKPEVVVLGIDPWLFSGEGLSRNSYKLFFPFINQPEVKDYVSRSVTSKSELLKVKIIKTSRYNALLLNSSIRGYMKNWDNLKFGVVDSTRYSREISERNFRRISFNSELMEDFTKVLDFLEKTDTKVVLLNTPVWKTIIDAQPADYLRSMKVIDSLKVIHCPSAILVDLVPRFSGSTSYFFDPIHLNPVGQNAVTEYFAGLMNSGYCPDKDGKIGEIIGEMSR